MLSPTRFGHFTLARLELLYFSGIQFEPGYFDPARLELLYFSRIRTSTLRPDMVRAALLVWNSNMLSYRRV